MSYSVYNPCEGDIVDPVCDPCLDEIEHGRVRGVALVHKNYVASLKADPDNATLWTDGITDKSIYIIPETQGTFDGGSPVEVPGYGDQQSKIVGFNYSAAFKDPSFKNNTAFYNSIKNSGNFHFAWRTENLTRLSNKPVVLIPKSPVAEDLSSEVVWDVEVKWFEKDQPVPFDTPAGVFVCNS